jgi:hypothetical protein
LLEKSVKYLIGKNLRLSVTSVMQLYILCSTENEIKAGGPLN